MDATKLYRNRDEFEANLKKVMKQAGITLPPPAKKAILSALSERDEDAAVCTDTKGNPEPDPDLRDTENVPLKEKIEGYFKREVLPHVPDAWIDETKTKIGYEVPFTRHFYEYTPMRSLAEIEAEIQGLEQAIQQALGQVLS